MQAYTEETVNEKGMLTSGVNKELNLVELVELTDHSFFIACQYHPEFLSRPGKPHPLFKGLIKASQDKLNQSN